VACDRYASPTPAAPSWVHAEAVLARLDEAQQELGEIARLRRGRLRLASIPTANATLVPRAIAEFSRRHPDVDLTVVDDHQQGLLSRLTRWELDLALVYDHESLPEPDVPLERTSLLDDPFDLVVPDGHPLTRPTSVALEELADQTWIGGTPDGAYGRIVLHSCRAAGFEPRVAFGSDDYNAVQAFVAVGLGVAILPRPGPQVHAPGPRPRRPRPAAGAADRRRPPGGQLPLRGHRIDARRAEGDRRCLHRSGRPRVSPPSWRDNARGHPTGRHAGPSGN
jgi:DNA-binding transcriptional LysR family regulator